MVVCYPVERANNWGGWFVTSKLFVQSIAKENLRLLYDCQIVVF
jgi:hypothetical protein